MIRPLREIYQLKIELKGIRPPIWRRFLISSSDSLEDLHHASQIVMGWTNSHLHQFVAGRLIYGMSDPEFGLDLGDSVLNERDFRIRNVLAVEKDSITYEYDFGDGWEHKITLEKILPFAKGQCLPVCLKGKRGCPPEDVGGVWGYKDFLQVWHDVDHPEHDQLKRWAGDYFEPEYFDIEEVNDVLKEVFDD